MPERPLLKPLLLPHVYESIVSCRDERVLAVDDVEETHEDVLIVII